MREVTATAHDIEDLYALFDQEPPTARVVDGVPQPHSRLLHHEAHMTVTLEEFHGGPVSLEVVSSVHRDERYARKILLHGPATGSDDRPVVQFGIMQVDFHYCSDLVKKQILEERTPLGRVLIQNHTLRRIGFHALVEIEADAEISEHFGVDPGTIVYGRLATIFCDDQPAVDLLEVLPPIDPAVD